MRIATIIVFAIHIFSRGFAQEAPFLFDDELRSIGLRPDNAHAPFYYGVASGDPAANGVVVWMKVHPRDSAKTEIINYEVALDHEFKQVLSSGELFASPERDFTGSIFVNGLPSGTEVFYRFSRDLHYSAIGQARTLPEGELNELHFAFTSCSCIFAGFFSAYRRMAERDDLAFILHLGDYIYDYADLRQLHRVLDDALPVDYASLEALRKRHTYYLLDPDLREARRLKTWITLWDNHDLDLPEAVGRQTAAKVFSEYVPMQVDADQERMALHRKFTFGDLFDLYRVDVFLQRNDSASGHSLSDMLGATQEEWLLTELTASTARWRFLASQKMMADWYSLGTPRRVSRKVGDGRLFDNGGWGGYPAARQKLFNHLRSQHIENFIALGGDIHMGFATELTEDALNQDVYSSRTGAGNYGVEICTPSLSRLNMRDYGVPNVAMPLARFFSRRSNPHHRWVDFNHHGYTTVHVTKSLVEVEVWHVRTRRSVEREHRRVKLQVERGNPQWQRMRW